jgi:hypothetical protein
MSLDREKVLGSQATEGHAFSRAVKASDIDLLLAAEVRVFHAVPLNYPKRTVPQRLVC